MLSLPWPHAAHTIHFSLPGQLTWYASGALIAFLMPFFFSSVLELENDVYYAIYFSGAAGFLTLYAVITGLDVVSLFTRNWRWSLAIGVLAAGFLISGVLQREDSTPHPEGLYFIFTIAWRGVLYGVIDGLILTAFPIAVAFALFDGQLNSLIRRAGFAVLALILSLTITATYHLGYEQFREDGIAGPETGNSIISIPAILTANPLGSVIAHASMHVAADVHAYETDLYLPPQTLVKANRGASPSEVQLTESDAGHRVELTSGGTLIIALVSNPSTGFSWYVGERSGPGLDLVDSPRYVPAGSTKPVPGAPGTEVFTFKASATGEETTSDTVQLVLDYRRSFEPDVPAEKTFEITVVIK